MLDNGKYSMETKINGQKIGQYIFEVNEDKDLYMCEK